MTSPFRALRAATLAALLLVGAHGFARADSTVVVNSNDTLQTIDGFGASSAWYAWVIHDGFWPAQQTAIIDALFSQTTGAGLSMLRQRIPIEMEPSSGQWDFSVDDDTLWLSQQAIARGVDKVWSTPWTPPAWMKTNNDPANGGELATTHYQDYADYLTKYIAYERSQLGSRFYAVSLQNEPDQSPSYESCLWNGNQFHDFLAGYLIPTFKRNGITTKVLMPELSYWSDWLASPTLSDPVTANFIGMVATHDYGGSIYPFTDAQAAGKPTWETEVSNLGNNDSSMSDALNWAINVHQSLTVANVSAWHYWWLVTSDSSGQSLITLNPSAGTFLINQRLWSIGNFSRFVRPGFQMMNLSSYTPEFGIYASAFRDPISGQIAVVVINNTSQTSNVTVKMPVFDVLRMTPYRTSATEALAPLPPLNLTNNVLAASAAPYSVTTYVGRGSVRNLSGIIRIDAGGGAVGSFLDDVDYSGGSTYAATAPIVTAGAAGAAPMAVYQTQRYGNCTYTFPGLMPTTQYKIRLHFAETTWTRPGQRLFNVAINGKQVLGNLDVLKAAGGQNRALIESFIASPGADHTIHIQFTNGAADNAMISGIELLPGTYTLPVQNL